MTIFVLPALIALAVGVSAGAALARWGPADPGAPRLPVAAIQQEVLRHPRMRGWLQARRDPNVLTGWAMTLAVLVMVLGFGAIGVLAVMVRSHRGFVHWDLSAARWGATHASATSTNVLRKITQFGGAVVLVPLAVVVTIVVVLRRRVGWLQVVGFMLMCVGGQYLVANIIKTVVDRARPDVLRLTGFSGASFPSGHATAAAATFAAFALITTVGRSRRVRAAAAGAAVGFAVLIAESRVLLGVHWLTDVIGGLALGWAWFALCSILFGGRILRFGAPAIVAEGTAHRVEGPGPRHEVRAAESG